MFKQPKVQTLTLVAYTHLYTNQNTSTEPALADYSLCGLPYIYCGHFFSKVSLTTLMLFKVLYCSITVHILFGSNTGLMPGSLRI